MIGSLISGVMGAAVGIGTSIAQNKKAKAAAAKAEANMPAAYDTTMLNIAGKLNRRSEAMSTGVLSGAYNRQIADITGGMTDAVSGLGATGNSAAGVTGILRAGAAAGQTLAGMQKEAGNIGMQMLTQANTIYQDQSQRALELGLERQKTYELQAAQYRKAAQQNLQAGMAQAGGVLGKGIDAIVGNAKS